MLQRLPIALAQVKEGNTSENFVNENQTNYIFFVSSKWNYQNVYNSLVNSIKLKNRMDNIFMNSKNSKALELHRILLNLSDKMNLKRNDKYVALSNLSIYYTWKNIKKSYKNNSFKISAPT